MYFLRAAYRVVKLIFAGVGIIAGGGLVIYGAVQALPVYAVGGGLYFITSVFLVFDSSKVLNDIKNEIDRMKGAVDAFQKENKKLAAIRASFEENNRDFAANNVSLRQRITALTQAEAVLQQENRKLEQQIQTVNDQLLRMDELKCAYEAENVKLQSLTKDYGMENDELRQTAEKMAATQLELNAENARMTQMLEDMQMQLIAMEQAKLEYEVQNKQYQELLTANAAQLTESNQQIEAMKAQIEKLRELHENSKQLIRNLVDAGDMFHEFSSTLGADLSKLDSTTGDITSAATDLNTTIARLNQQLTEAEFGRLDADGDGVVTREEFGQYLK